MNPINFDEWRKNYDSMTFADHQAMAGEFLELYPEQAHYNRDGARAFLDLGAEFVLELGGWRGDLAAEVLARCPQIETWINYDILPASAASAQKCGDWRYQFRSLDCWLWEWPARFSTVFVATHVFEHMKWAQLEKLIAWIPESVHTAVIEAPLADGVIDWTGYHGSHILEVGWEEIERALLARGLRRHSLVGAMRLYRRDK